MAIINEYPGFNIFSLDVNTMFSRRPDFSTTEKAFLFGQPLFAQESNNSVHLMPLLTYQLIAGFENTQMADTDVLTLILEYNADNKEKAFRLAIEHTNGQFTMLDNGPSLNAAANPLFKIIAVSKPDLNNTADLDICFGVANVTQGDTPVIIKAVRFSSVGISVPASDTYNCVVTPSMVASIIGLRLHFTNIRLLTADMSLGENINVLSQNVTELSNRVEKVETDLGTLDIASRFVSR